MGARFLTQLRTEHLGDQRKRLEADLAFVDGRGRVFHVAPGFVSDGASVPRPLWALFPAFGAVYEPAAWLHDYAYQCAEVLETTLGAGTLERVEADALLYEASRALGFNPIGAWLLWLGVRIGGWRPWNRYRRAAAIASVRALQMAIAHAKIRTAQRSTSIWHGKRAA